MEYSRSRTTGSFWNSDASGQKLRLSRAKGFEAYANFMKQADIVGPDPVRDVGALVPIHGERMVNLLCLNTAFFSDKYFSDDEERGKSPFPVQTFLQLVPQGKTNAELFVVGHHPLHWFEPQSREQFVSTLLEYNAIYLHGHEHQIKPTFGPYALQSLGFGASYPARLDSKSPQPYTSKFAVCELDDMIHVRFISWDSENGCWRPFHSLSPTIRDRSKKLEDGYSIVIPTTRLSHVPKRRGDFSRQIESRPTVTSPIWIEGKPVESWATLLCDLDLIAEQHSTMAEDIQEIPTHSRFFIQDGNGTHLIHTATAETAVITYDHVESANTQLDTMRLSSCIIATFGSITSAASNLANNLRRTKILEILDGKKISDRLSKSGKFRVVLDFVSSLEVSVSITPLIWNEDISFLVVDAVRNAWFSIVDPQGTLLHDSNSLVNAVRTKLPHLKALSLRTTEGIISTKTEERLPEPFDRTLYLERCLTVFDTAQYAGLASVGVRLPIESLRQIYVPTSANVEQHQSAIEATERAIDDLVETLGLDEHQREHLSRQMKTKYGLQQSSEVGAASRLYQNLSNIAVLGDPGSGKSCFVRSEIMSYCTLEDRETEDWYGMHIPVFLPLAEYVHSHDGPMPLLDQCVIHANSQGLDLRRTQLETLFPSVA